MRKPDFKFKKAFPRGFMFLIFMLLLLPAQFSLAEDVYEERLNEGLKNTEPYSYVLTQKAQSDPANAKQLLKDAMKYSPDSPSVYFEIAKTGFSLSPETMFESLDYAMKGVKAYENNFWWLMSLAGLLTVSLASSIVLMLGMIILIRFFMDAPLIAHDIKEDKQKIVLVLLLVPLSFLGPLFFITGSIMLLGIYFRAIDKAIVYMAILFMLVSPLAIRYINIFLSSSSPELRAIAAVNEGRDNKYASAVLKGKNDPASLFSYGLALKREGRYEEAIETYKTLIASAPEPAVYINLGNCYFNASDMALAKDFYKKALDITPSVAGYYNLSQASRESLDFAKGEEYFLEATKLGRETVSKLTANTSRNPNRMILDETLPISALWKYAAGNAKSILRISLLPPAFSALAAVVLGILFYMINGRMKYRAYRCKRCDIILCGKCSKELLWGQMCAKCYKSIVKLEGLDSRERVARLLEVQELQTKKRRMLKVLSFAPPGIAHIYAGRILVGGIFLWLSLFSLITILLNPLFSTGLYLFSHSWLVIPSAALMAILYLVANIRVRSGLNKGWL